MKHLERILGLLLIVLLANIIFVYNRFSNTIKWTFKNITNIEVHDTKKIADTIEKNIRLYVNRDLYKTLKNNANLRKKLNKILSTFENCDIKYVYVIYKDKHGSLRYLLDGTKNPKERGSFNQKFIPEKNIWYKCFTLKKDQYAIQQSIQSLWLTYLHPIINGSKVEGVIALDMSITAYENLKNVVKPLKKYVLYLIVFDGVVVIAVAFLTLLYFKEKEIAIVDPLTRLYNRGYLQRKQDSLNKEDFYIGLLDIDFFKKVNDTYGHDMGDEVLRIVAKRLMTFTRGEDILIRFGGEEFLILFAKGKKHLTLEEIKKAVERVQKKVSEGPIRLKNVSINITVSMGVDPYTYKRSSLEESIKIADTMLYKAKEMGRNRAEIAKE